MSHQTAAPTAGPTPAIATAPTTAFKLWLCVLCGFIYSEHDGLPQAGIAPGTRWADVPETWVCPECGAGKGDFEMTEI